MNTLDKVKKQIESASKKYKVAPCDVSSAQFWSISKDIKEWEIRKLGGFTGIRDSLFPAPSKNTVLPRVAHSKKVRLITPKLNNFTVHTSDIDELFKMCKLKDNEVLRVVVQPDTHAPEHDEKAINAFCDFLKWYQPHGLINLGDFMEMGGASHWPSRDAKPKRLIPEIKEGKKLLEKIGKAAGPKCIYKRFLIGNHEDWLQQLLVSQIPEVLDGLDEVGPSLRIQDLLGLKDFGYRVIPLNEILQLGDAHFIHGYYTGRHHASSHLGVFGVNIYYGHLHDVQSHSGVSVKGMHEAMSLGCLRTLNAPFLKGKPHNWAHAFGIFEFRKDGSYTRYVPIMVDGKFSFNGKVFG